MIPRLDITLSASSLSCYTHDAGVTLYPYDFFADVTKVARDLSLDYAVWDHGDGTISKSLTSTHKYETPGQYKATLFVYDNEGQQYRSSTQLTIDVHNYISDKLTWVNAGSVFNIPASTKKWYPFKLQLFKSWQTWPSVSATGYSLSLNVSGSNSEKLNIHDYYNDKWSHLRNIWTFHRPITSGAEEIMLPIERYDLKDSTVKLYLSSYTDTAGNEKTLLTSVSGKDVTFVGTSAVATFYYYDETPKNFTSKDDPAICFASLDTKDFNPEYNTGTGRPPVTLDLAQTQPVVMPVRVRSSYSSKISINSTGLPSFSLPKTVYEGSKVPFFVCFTDDDNNAKENNYPALTGTTDRIYNNTSDFYKVRLSLLDSAGKSVSADFFSGGWDDVLPKEVPNYYRGYFIPRETVTGGKIHAESYLIDKLTASREYFHSYFVSPPLSSVFVVTRPDKRIKYDWPISVGKVKVDIVDSKETDVGEHEIYPICVTPDQSVIGQTFDRSHLYVGDGKSRKIYKLDYEGKRQATFDQIEKAVAKNFPPRVNNSPTSWTDSDPVVSRIASDKDGNLWVSLFDSISSFKIDGGNGDILATIADIDFNKYFQRGTTYYSYSDTDTSEYKIQDLGKPVCIETDINSGPWIGYDTVSGSHVSNYDSKGIFKKKVNLQYGQFIYDIMVNNHDVLWASTYYDRTTRPTIKNITDSVDEVLIYKDDDLDYSTLKFKFICKDDTHMNDLIARDEFDVVDLLDSPDHKINLQYLEKSRSEQYELSDDPEAVNNATLSAHYTSNYKDRVVYQPILDTEPVSGVNSNSPQFSVSPMYGTWNNTNARPGVNADTKVMKWSTDSSNGAGWQYMQFNYHEMDAGELRTGDTIKVTGKIFINTHAEWIDHITIYNYNYSGLGFNTVSITDKGVWVDFEQISVIGDNVTAHPAASADHFHIRAVTKKTGGGTNNDYYSGRVFQGTAADFFLVDDLKVVRMSRNNKTFNQKRNVLSYKVRCHQSAYWHQFPEMRSYRTKDHPDMLLRIRQSDEIIRISGGGSTVQKHSGFLYPTYLTIDLNNNVWVTHSNNILSNIIDDPANLAGTYVFDQYVGETTAATPSAYNVNLQFQNHDALTCTMNNDVYVLDNFHRKMYVINADDRTVTTSTNILSPEQDEVYEKQIKSSPNYVEGEAFSYYYQAIGDWNGIRYFHKFENNAIAVKRLTGEHTLDISPSSGKYHAFKFNEDYDAESVLKSYRTQPNLSDSDQIFEKFFGQGIGNNNSHPASLGKKMYETTGNFVLNHSNTETCNIKSLNSLAQMGGINIDSQYRYSFPGSLKRVMDIASIRKDTLWGKRNKFVRNFTNVTGLPANAGKRLDVKSTMIVPGSALIAHDLFSNKYLLIVPHFLKEDFNVDLKNNKIEEFAYPLSGFNTIDGKEYNWNWSIMDTVTGMNIDNFYHFYEFIGSTSDIQETGVIDWSNPHNTVAESSTNDDWVKDNGIIDQMLEYELRKNLDLFSTASYTQKLSASTKYAVTDLNLKSTAGTSNIETIQFLQQAQTSYIPTSGAVIAGRTISSGTTITEKLQGESPTTTSSDTEY
ncbi:hypothetical protein H8E06_00550 [bacterium]|nr:hypothetical protein [bacterium]